MYNIDYEYCISIAIFTGILLCFFAYCVNVLRHGRFLMSKRRIVIVGCTILCLAVGTGAFFGLFEGESIKEGDYSDHQCRRYIGGAKCDEPPSYRVHTGMGNVVYYCEDHKEDAYEKYDFFANYVSSDDEKCKSCGRKFSDNDNKICIAKTGMCNNCYHNFETLKPFIGE